MPSRPFSSCGLLSRLVKPKKEPSVAVKQEHEAMATGLEDGLAWSREDYVREETERLWEGVGQSCSAAATMQDRAAAPTQRTSHRATTMTVTTRSMTSSACARSSFYYVLCNSPKYLWNRLYFIQIEWISLSFAVWFFFYLDVGFTTRKWIASMPKIARMSP